MADECLNEVNERSSYVVRASYLDEDGDPVTPDSATYRIDRPVLKLNILPATAIASLSTFNDLLITSDQNQIFRSRSVYELQEVTVEFDYTGVLGPMHGTAKYSYKVLNLYGVVTVPSASVSPSASMSPSA